MKKSIVLAFVAFFSLCPVCHCGELEMRLELLAKSHKGRVAIAVRHLGTGESFYLNADEPMPTASLIKLPVMVEVYFQAAEGKLKLSDPVTLRKEDKVQGAGVLTEHFTAGLIIPIEDAVNLMIAVSDNTATNLVLDKIGIPATGKRMESLGYRNTRINAKVFLGSKTSIDPERTKRFGLGSTSAREMVDILEKLHKGDLVSKEASKAMIEKLRKCDDNLKFPRYLTGKATVAHKTGSVNEVKTDAGILTFTGGPVALCVLTADNEDKGYQVENAGNVFCAKVAKEVVDYFAGKVKAPG